MSSYTRRSRLAALLLALSLLAGACGGDDGATVRTIGTEDGSSASSSGSASALASGSTAAPGTPVEVDEVEEDGGYTYASDVNAHRLVTLDVCTIKGLLDAEIVDYESIREVYVDGGSSVNSDGSVRTLAGFATAEDRLHGLEMVFDSATPLDDFVTSAIDGSGAFDGASDDARAQGIEKGVQNQIMVAWTVHELNTALQKADAGEFDAAEGAPHNWDEAWAFYHGADPACAPYATADSRADNFGTADAGGTATANTAILAAIEAGRDALLAEDRDGAAAAREEILRNLVITYSQATIRYAEVAAQDVADGDLDAARGHQAEGLAFFRVLQPLLGDVDADLTPIAAVYDLSAEPGSGDGDLVREVLAPALDTLGITDDEIGTLA